jgi:hypothetical protein
MTHNRRLLSTHKLTTSIVIGAAAIALAGGFYGIVSATSGSGSAAVSRGAAGGPGPAAGDPTSAEPGTTPIESNGPVTPAPATTARPRLSWSTCPPQP